MDRAIDGAYWISEGAARLKRLAFCRCSKLTAQGGRKWNSGGRGERSLRPRSNQASFERAFDAPMEFARRQAADDGDDDDGDSGGGSGDGGGSV